MRSRVDEAGRSGGVGVGTGRQVAGVLTNSPFRCVEDYLGARAFLADAADSRTLWIPPPVHGPGVPPVQRLVHYLFNRLVDRR